MTKKKLFYVVSGILVSGLMAVTFGGQRADEKKLKTEKCTGVYVACGETYSISKIAREKRGEILMKRVVANVVVLALVMGLVIGASAEAKTKTEKKVCLNKTSVSVGKGKSIQLKMKNTKKKVKWSSSNEFTARVSQKGKVMGLRLGQVTVTAKCGGKKYKCKVRVTSGIDADKITMSYGNHIFTEDLYKKVVRIKGGSCADSNSVTDPAAIKLIYSKLAAVKLTESDDKEILYGETVCDLVLDNGEVFNVSINRYVTVNGVRYTADLFPNEIAALISEYKDWGNV